MYAFQWIQTAEWVLVANYTELKAIPDRLDGNLALTGQHNPEVAGLHRDFIRRLLNYLGSVKTLVDTTRTFKSRHVPDEAFDREFNEHLQALLQHGVIAFMQELGNPVRHAQLPRVAITTTFPDGRSLRRQMTLSLSELTKMRDWTVNARAYLQQAKQGYYEDKQYIDLTSAAAEYQEHVCVFYQWFYHAVATLKAPMMNRFYARRAELTELQERAFERAEANRKIAPAS
jgi:hypothetical protein